MVYLYILLFPSVSDNYRGTYNHCPDNYRGTYNHCPDNYWGTYNHCPDNNYRGTYNHCPDNNYRGTYNHCPDNNYRGTYNHCPEATTTEAPTTTAQTPTPNQRHLQPFTMLNCPDNNYWAPWFQPPAQTAPTTTAQTTTTEAPIYLSLFSNQAWLIRTSSTYQPFLVQTINFLRVWVHTHPACQIKNNMDWPIHVTLVPDKTIALHHFSGKVIRTYVVLSYCASIHFWSEYCSLNA